MDGVVDTECCYTPPSVNNNTVEYTGMNNNIAPYTARDNNNSNQYQVMNNNVMTYKVRNNQSKPYQVENKNIKPYHALYANNMPATVFQDPTITYAGLNNSEFKPKILNANSKSMDSVYNTLRRQVPTFPYEKRLSKIDTLNLSIAYINLLKDILGSSMEPVKYIQQSLEEDKKQDKLEWKTSDLTARLHWVNWNSIGEGGPTVTPGNSRI